MKKGVIIGIVLGVVVLGIIGFFLLGADRNERGDDVGQESIGQTSESVEPSDLTQITFFTEQEGKAVDPDWSVD